MSLRVLGALALACWIAHSIELAVRGEVHSMLWVCNLAGLLVAGGALARAPVLVAVGELWLVFGTPMWALDLLYGGELLPTSLLSHFGVLVLGALALARTGWPRGAWWIAAVAQVVVLFASRIVTAPEHNVNLSHRVHDGWEDVFPSYALYFAVLQVGSALAYLAIEIVARRLGARSERMSCAT